jgi:hypothetical protein
VGEISATEAFFPLRLGLKAMKGADLWWPQDIEPMSNELCHQV